MSTVATLTIDMVGKSAKLFSEFKKSSKGASQWAREVEKDINRVSGFVTKLGGTTAATFASFAAAENRVQELENLSNIARTSVEDFKQYALAAKTVGIESEKLADISKDTLEKLGEYIATGGGGFKDFFEQVAPQVGLTAQELQNLSGPEVLIAVQRAMDKVNISAEKQSFYLESIASDTTNLIPLLKNEGEQFKNVNAEAVTLTQSFAHFGDVVAQVINDLDNEAGASSSLKNWISDITTRLDSWRTGVDTLESLKLKQEDIIKQIENRRLRGHPAQDLQEKLALVTQEINFLSNSYVSSVNEMFEGTEFGLAGTVDTTQEQIDNIQSSIQDFEEFADGMKPVELDKKMFSGGDWESAFDLPGFQEQLDQFKDYSEGSFAEFIMPDFSEVESPDWTTILGVDEYKASLGEIKAAQQFHDQLMLSAQMDFASNSISLMKMRKDEGSIIWKAALLAEKGLMVSKAFMQANLNATMAAASQFAIPTPDAPIRAAAASESARNWGYANAALIAAQAIASFEGGGYIKDGPRVGGVDGRGGKLAVLHPNEKVTDLTKDGPSTGKVEIHYHVNDTMDNVVSNSRRHANRTKNQFQQAVSRPN